METTGTGQNDSNVKGMKIDRKLLPPDPPKIDQLISDDDVMMQENSLQNESEKVDQHQIDTYMQRADQYNGTKLIVDLPYIMK